MAKSRSSPASPPTEEAIDRLTAAVDRLADQMEQIGQHARVIEDLLEAVRDDLQWAVNNDKLRCPVPPMHVTSMPLDPLTPNFAEHINRVGPAEIAAIRASMHGPDDKPEVVRNAPQTRPTTGGPGTLFTDED